MKRTTYILMGLLVSGLIVIVATILTLYMSDEKTFNADVVFGSECAELNLNGVRVVKMMINPPTDDEKKHVIVNGNFVITSPTGSEEDKISYPKSEYLNVNQRGDTLFVEFDFNAPHVPAQVRAEDYFLAVGLDVRLTADSLTSILSTMKEVKLALKEMKADSLSVRVGRQEVLVDSCQFRSFDILGSGLKFYATNSKIENFYLDLDDVWDWMFEHSEVGTEYLTGSNRHSNNLQEGECERVIWTPKVKDAQLSVTFSEKTEIRVLPQ